MNTFYTRSQNINHDVSYEPSSSYDNKNVIVGSPSLISELQYEQTNEDEKNPSYRWTSDITLLFNQERIANSLSTEQIRQWLLSMNRPNNNKVDFSNVPDDLIMQTIKSRHIQSLSELKAWTDELIESADSLINEYNLLEREFIESQKSAVDSSISVQKTEE